MSGVSGNKGLNFGGKFDIKDIIANQEKVIKGFNEIKKASGGLTAKDFDTKPMTAYQAAMVKAKEQTLALAKAKQEDLAASRSASLVLQKALADERLAREAINTATAKNRLEVSEAVKLAKEQASVVKKLNEETNKPVKNRNFGIEITGQNDLANSTTRANSVMSAQVVARAKLTAEAARQAVAEGNLRSITSGSASASQAQTQATNSLTLSKKQLAQQLILEKATQQAAQSALRAYTLEQAAAKGSLEQRKLALDRLVLAQSRLNEQERNSPAGLRLTNIVRGLSDQVKNLDSATKGSISSLKSQEGVFTSLKSQLLGVAAGYASFAAAAATAKAIVHTNAEVSDSMADVQRTAKLTADETDGLVDSLKGLDRRSNLTSLLDIGYIGGQMGVGKKDIQGYIEKIDELGVVLKKEFPGGAEAVAISLGKLNSIYKITASQGITLEESLGKIGSALLGIAHDGPVNVQYLQDFALRTAGVAQVAKLSLPTMLAYGAVLSEAGVTAQVAGSSVNRLISSIAGKREKYFAIAQLADSTLTIEKFTKLINTDTKSALDLFFKGLRSGNPTQTEFNDRMSTLNFRVGAATNSITALALNQDKLTRKIEIGNDEYDRGALSTENYAIKNNTLAASIDKVGNAFSNITTDPNSGIGKSIKFVLDATTDAILALDKLMGRLGRYKSAYDDFFDRVTMAVFNAPEASARVNERNLTKQKLQERSRVESRRDEVSAQGKIQAKDIIDKNGTEKELRSALKIEEGLFKSYSAQRSAALAYLLDPKNTDDKLRKVAETKSKNLMDILFRQKVKLDLIRSSLTGQYGAVQKQEGQDQEEIIDVSAIKKEIKELTEANIKLKNTGKQFEINVSRIRDLRKQLKEAGGGVDNSGAKQESAFESMAKRRNAIQKDITDQIELSKRKQLSSDEEEVASVGKKYQDLKDKANEYYADLAKQQKSGKLTAKQASGLGVTLSGLDTAEVAQKQVIIDKQSSERFKRQLEEQASLFTQFESYKETFGKESAEKRYKNEFTTAEDYAKKLENIQTLLLSEITDPADATEAQKSQLESVKTQIDSVNKYRQQKNEEALKEFMDYATKRNLLTEKYNNDLILLEGNPERIAVRTKIYNEDLKELDDANARKLESYQELFKGIEDLSNKSALKLLENARRQLSKDIKSGAIVDPDEIAKVKKYFNDVERTIKSGTGQALIGLANGMNDLIENIGKFDKSLGETLKTITDIVGQLGNVSKGFDDFKKAQGKGDTLGMASGAIGILSAGLSIFQGIDAVFSKNKQREEQNAYNLEMQGKQNESLNKLLERQISLLDKVYGTERIKNYDSAIREARDNETKYLSQLENRFVLTGDKYLDEKIAELNNTGKLSGIALGKLEEEIRKKVAKLPKDINELQKLLDEGKLDAGTASIVENLIKANQTAIDLKNNLRQELTGSSIDKLAEDFISTLTDGTQDFGKTFEETIQKSIINGFKGEIIRKQLQAFYEQFATLSEGGLTKDEIDALRKSYLEAGEQAKKDIENIQNITGINLSGENKPGEGIKGKLQRELTETTASEFLGVTRNIYEIQVKQMNIMNLSLDFARAGVQQLELIQINTANTVLRLQDTVLRLDDVVANTKPAQTQRDLGR